MALAAWLSMPIPSWAATTRVGRVVMGTVLEILVVADEQGLADSLAAEAIDLALRWDRVLTTWRDDGELLRLNRSAGRGPITVSEDLAAALRTMIELSSATGGTFDPAVGPIVDRLRSGQAPREDRSPVARRISTALRLPSAGTAEIISGAALDAGGIGKGIALDAIAAHLRERGARAAFLDFGSSSLLAFGQPENTRAWSVMLSSIGTGSVLGTVDLISGSLSTSRAADAGDPAGAIIDPRTGRPIEARRLVTVLAADATTADAWSTALVVMGPEGLEHARQAGIEAIVVDETGIVTTAAFSGLVHPPTPRRPANSRRGRHPARVPESRHVFSPH